MAGRNIIVIGGSAGGIVALEAVLKGMPREIPATLFVVVHTPADNVGALPQILNRVSRLPASFPHDGEEYRQGHVYVAPPDQHLLLSDGQMTLLRGPRENGFRPAVDPLFRSAAQQHGSRVVGVILSGALDDGTFGLLAIKKAGGVAIVQHPYEAALPNMPLSAIQNVEVDHIVRADQIPPLLMSLALSEPALSERAEARPVQLPASGGQESQAEAGLAGEAPDTIAAPPSIFTCPDCGGTLWEIAEGRVPRYRCHTGHGYTPAALLAAQCHKLEEALWNAVRVMEERAALHRSLAEMVASRNMETTALRYAERAEAESQQAHVIREVLRQLGQFEEQRSMDIAPADS